MGKSPIRLMDLMYKEGEIRTIYRYKNNFRTAISAIASETIKVNGMISAIFPLNTVPGGF